MSNQTLPTAPPRARGQSNTYVVTAPDGTVYEVEAPAGATEDDVLARVQEAHAPKLPDADEQAYAQLTADPKSSAQDIIGFLKQRGFGADENVVNEFIAKRSQPGVKVQGSVRYQLPAAPEAPDNSLREDIRGAAASFVDGLIPGSAKAARGTREVILNALRSPFTDENFDPGAAYDKGAQDITRWQGQFAKDNPNTDAALTIAGFGTGMAVLPQATVFRGGRLAAGVGNGALNGATYGALSGALNDSGDGRLSNAGLGVLAGSALGAAAPVAAQRLAGTVSTARRNVPGLNGALTAIENLPRRLTGREVLPANRQATAQAERILGRELGQSTIDAGMGTQGPRAVPDAITAEVIRRAALQVPAVPADVSEQARRVTAWALQGNGPMSQRARGVLSARQAQQAERVRGHVADEIGAPVDPEAYIERVSRQAQDEARPLYEEAYAQPLNITPDMVRVSKTPAFQDALPVAQRNIRNDMRDPRAMGFIVDDAGEVIRGPVNDISTEGMDQVIRAMRDNGRAAADLHPITGRVINNTNSLHINRRAGDLRDMLAEQNPAYREATERYADHMGIRDGFERGQDIASLTGPEIAAQMRQMPQPNAREAWMTGGATELADVATQAGLKPAANVAQRVRQAVGLSGAGGNAALGDQAKVQAIEAMAGRPGMVRGLDSRLEAEDQAFRTFQAAAPEAVRGSPFEREDVGNLAVAAGKASRGDLLGAITSALLQGNPRGTLRFREDVRERIAELMTATEPRSVAEAMQAISRRAEADEAFRVSLSRAGIDLSKGLIAQAAAQDTEARPTADEVAEHIDAPMYTRLYP